MSIDRAGDRHTEQPTGLDAHVRGDVDGTTGPAAELADGYVAGCTPEGCGAVCPAGCYDPAAGVDGGRADVAADAAPASSSSPHAAGRLASLALFFDADAHEGAEDTETTTSNQLTGTRNGEHTAPEQDRGIHTHIPLNGRARTREILAELAERHPTLTTQTGPEQHDGRPARSQQRPHVQTDHAHTDRTETQGDAPTPEFLSHNATTHPQGVAAAATGGAPAAPARLTPIGMLTLGDLVGTASDPAVAVSSPVRVEADRRRVPGWLVALVEGVGPLVEWAIDEPVTDAEDRVAAWAEHADTRALGLLADVAEGCAGAEAVDLGDALAAAGGDPTVAALMLGVDGPQAVGRKLDRRFPSYDNPTPGTGPAGVLERAVYWPVATGGPVLVDDRPGACERAVGGLLDDPIPLHPHVDPAAVRTLRELDGAPRITVVGTPGVPDPDSVAGRTRALLGVAGAGCSVSDHPLDCAGPCDPEVDVDGAAVEAAVHGALGMAGFQLLTPPQLGDDTDDDTLLAELVAAMTHPLSYEETHLPATRQLPSPLEGWMRARGLFRVDRDFDDPRLDVIADIECGMADRAPSPVCCPGLGPCDHGRPDLRANRGGVHFPVPGRDLPSEPGGHHPAGPLSADTPEEQ